MGLEARKTGLTAHVVQDWPTFRRGAAKKKDRRQAGIRWHFPTLLEFCRRMGAAGAAWLFDAVTGVRRTELARVIWPDILLLDDGPILRLTEEHTKTEDARDIPLGAWAYGLAVAARQAVGSDTAPLFDLREHRRLRGRIAKEMELDRVPHLRDVRHTVASMIAGLQGRGGIHLAKELLGHSEISTTEGYVHADLAELRGALAELDALVAEAAPTVAASLPHVGSPPYAQEGHRMARDARFELTTFGFGGHGDSRKWLQSLALAVQEERLRTAHDGEAPDHLTGSPIKVAAGGGEVVRLRRVRRQR